VQYIERGAFLRCKKLTKVEFEHSTSSPHQLRTIDECAFSHTSLQKIKLPSSVTAICEFAFSVCQLMVEANLSKTTITQVSSCAFNDSTFLQTVSLPNTLERIGDSAFGYCSDLVTVVVPHDSQPIRIGRESFFRCGRLAIVMLPRGSTFEKSAFTRCNLLRKRYGGNSSGIAAGLVGRFDGFSLHKLCYDHSSITTQELRQCIMEHSQEEGSHLDSFDMTPFHVFFSTAEPSIELLDVLLDSLPNQMLKWKDANENRPLDYLINNWNDGTIHLLQRTLQKWMIDRVACWGTASRREAMQSKVRQIFAEEDKTRRATLCNEAYSALEHYENEEAMSILELALWKSKLKSEMTSGDGSKRQTLDREECRCVSGCDVVIPRIGILLDI